VSFLSILSLFSLQDVKQNMNPAKLTVFDKVTVEVKKIICRDSINAFVASKVYLDFKGISSGLRVFFSSLFLFFA
jgi:hypothetical protein